MTGLEPPIHHKKKRFDEVNIHLNSSVILAADDKVRVKSDYMKRFQDAPETKIKIDGERPAGAKTHILRKPT